MKQLVVLGVAASLVSLGVLAVALADPNPKSKAKPTAAPAAPGATPRPPPTPAQIADAKKAFGEVFLVLQSPRCRNCHPSDGVPKQTDDGVPHAMNISRLSFESGLACTTCHSTRNSEESIGLVGGPPGALHWGLPPKETPMIFEGHTPTSLCEQLKDPTKNGKRSLTDIVHHVEHDALVLWGWKPGGNRTLPPMSHKAFVDAVQRWASGNGACPEPSK